MLLGRFNDDRSMAWCTYKLFLCHVGDHFGGVACPWNRSYANAQKWVPPAGAGASAGQDGAGRRAVGAARGVRRFPLALLHCLRRGHQLAACAATPPLRLTRPPTHPARIFRNKALLSGVRTQHATLYATHLGKARVGVLRDAADFFALLNHGRRQGQRRYFTYSLMHDGMRCSETGALLGWV